MPPAVIAWDADALLTWTVGNGSIENRSHCVRDATYGEGTSGIRKGRGPEISAAPCEA
jgi:hypothetical protein